MAGPRRCSRLPPARPHSSVCRARPATAAAPHPASGRGGAAWRGGGPQRGSAVGWGEPEGAAGSCPRSRLPTGVPTPRPAALTVRRAAGSGWRRRGESGLRVAPPRPRRSSVSQRSGRVGQTLANGRRKPRASRHHAALGNVPAARVPLAGGHRPAAPALPPSRTSRSPSGTPRRCSTSRPSCPGARPQHRPEPGGLRRGRETRRVRARRSPCVTPRQPRGHTASREGSWGPAAPSAPPRGEGFPPEELKASGRGWEAARRPLFPPQPAPPPGEQPPRGKLPAPPAPQPLHKAAAPEEEEAGGKYQHPGSASAPSYLTPPCPLSVPRGGGSGRSVPAWSRLGSSSSAWEAPSCSLLWPQQVTGSGGRAGGGLVPVAGAAGGGSGLEPRGADGALPCRAQPCSATPWQPM